MKVEFDNIYKCDVLDGLRNLPDKCIDVIITSPPYNKYGLQGRHKAANWNKNIIYGGDINIDNIPEVQYQKWQIEILNECYRVLKDDGSMFYNHKNRIHHGTIYNPYSWVSLSKFNVYQEIIWERNGTPNFDNIRYLPTTEKIFFLTKGKPSFVRSKSTQYKGEVWRIGQKRNTEHPAPFPIELPDNILQCIPNNLFNKVVLDPFMGSGTTAVSAVKHGFHYIGFELFDEYIDMANKRIKEIKNENIADGYTLCDTARV